MISLPQIAAELDREAAARRRTYPALIDKGRLTERDAQFEHAALAALIADVALMQAPLVPVPELSGLPCRPLPGEATHGQTWRQRRDTLHRELDRRARLYPGWIDTARLTRADAAHQVACLEALLAIYDEGWGFPPAPPGREAERLDHFACEVWPNTRTAAARGPKPQQEMAL